MKNFIKKLKAKIKWQKKILKLEKDMAICELDCLKKKIELEKIEKLLNKGKAT